jgi:hypothetical protein
MVAESQAIESEGKPVVEKTLAMMREEELES